MSTTTEEGGWGKDKKTGRGGADITFADMYLYKAD